MTLTINTITKSLPKKMEKLNAEIQPLLPDGIFLSTNSGQLNEIIDFKKDYYNDDRSEVKNFHDDGFDQDSYVLFSKNIKGEIVSTARLLMDSEKGFPEEEILPDSVHSMRREGKKVAELGRLVIVEDTGAMLRRYYKSIYNISMCHDIDIVLIVMKKRNIPSHNKMMAISVLSYDMGNSWDEEQGELCLVAWDIKADQPRFHKWVSKDGGNANFEKKEWNQYSSYHLGVLVSVQHEVYSHIASKVKGRVADLGCGSGRIMGYIQENTDVESYTGVDSSDDMIKQAVWLSGELEYDEANFVNKKIEEVDGSYDSIVSVHSFYTWPNVKAILSHIYDVLSDNGTFYLVTPNDNFSVDKLSRLVKREVLGHPYYNEFLSINYAIAGKYKYSPIDILIEQVRSAGFHIQEAHDKFFLGGASYLELTKKLHA